ncbi:MAG: multifunctional CCA addition/repair protein [Endozoicomonas sp.]
MTTNQSHSMKIHLVGGAVRDKLLGLPVKDHDWVVTNATPEQMRKQGYTPVGQDFPVFLHPETKEEYALARTERKSGHGYTGFVFHASPDVTLEQDLLRRDLTINAMAEAEDGTLIDPYNGYQDLNQRLLRHVSPAFREDPLRILRVARFAARFQHLGFAIAEETMTMMKEMVDSGEASHLVPERVWQETHRALMEPTPEVYFQTLQDCGALSVVMPEWQPFLTTDCCLKAVRLAADNNADDSVRFACLFADAGGSSIEELDQLAQRLRFPARFKELGMLVFTSESRLWKTLENLNGETLISLFEETDALRRPERFSDYLEACRYIAEARGNTLPDHALQKVTVALTVCQAVNASEIVQQGFKGREIGEQLRLARIKAINQHSS